MRNRIIFTMKRLAKVLLPKVYSSSRLRRSLLNVKPHPVSSPSILLEIEVRFCEPLFVFDLTSSVLSQSPSLFSWILSGFHSLALLFGEATFTSLIGEATFASPAHCWAMYKFRQLERSDRVVNDYGMIVGTVLLTRRRMVEEFVTELVSEMCPHHYWRGPRGCFKTTFVKLVGEELLSRNYDVYYLNNSNLVSELIVDLPGLVTRNRANNVRTAFIVDEADMNPNSSFFLLFLKDPLYNDVVLLAAGVTKWSMDSVGIRYKHIVDDIFLHRIDAVELTYAWMKISALNGITVSRTDMVGFCEWVIEYTHGNTFMVMMMCHHFFTSVAIFNAHFNTYEEYLTSSFLLTDDFAAINRRCIGKCVLEIFIHLYERGTLRSDEKTELTNSGYWSVSTSSFSSRLLLTVFCNVKAIIPENVPSFNSKEWEAVTVQEKIEALIVYGRSGMNQNDFKVSTDDSTRIEDAVGIGWQRGIREKFHTLFIEPHPRSLSAKDSSGSSTRFDCKFNGKMNVAIELNVDNYGLYTKDSKLKKRKTGGVFQRFRDKAAILVFQVNKTNRPVGNDLVYYFNMTSNTLYRGNTLICKGVSNYLQTAGMNIMELERKSRMFRSANQIAQYFSSENGVSISDAILRNARKFLGG